MMGAEEGHATNERQLMTRSKHAIVTFLLLVGDEICTKHSGHMTPIFRLLRFTAVAALAFPWVAAGAPESPALFEPANVVTKELAPGELIPDVALRDSRGAELHLGDLRGRTVAITFFYSRCTAATFCPMVGRKFDAAQALLARMEFGRNCHLLSISLDPERDTADMLAAYAQGYGADLEHWTFAAGNYEDIRKLGDAVGLEYKRVGERIDHNLRTVIVDASGHIRRIFRGDEWTPQELVAELGATSRRFR